jgi:hypothetical protein
MDRLPNAEGGSRERNEARPRFLQQVRSLVGAMLHRPQAAISTCTTD